MRIPIFQVDAFSDKLFGGNPAVVCPLPGWLPDETLQAIAAENNLAETAFFVEKESGYHLRWFTPACKVDLCGHATLATAYVLFSELGRRDEKVEFDTLSGRLSVTKSGDMLALHFPARKPEPVTPDPKLWEALGIEETEILAARDYLVILKNQQEVLSVQPDMTKLARIDRFATIVTSVGETADFVSRFFAPAKGVPEDPVTGSAHCTLIPFWAERLGKTEMQARQLSQRGGDLWCKYEPPLVEIAGSAVMYLRGEIEV